MNHQQQTVLWTLRMADEPFLPEWQLAKRSGLTIRQTAATVRSLRSQQLVVKRRCNDGLSRFEISLVRSGL